MLQAGEHMVSYPTGGILSPTKVGTPAERVSGFSGMLCALRFADYAAR